MASPRARPAQTAASGWPMRAQSQSASHRIQETEPTMAHRPTLSSCLVVTAGLLAAACGGHSNVSNASPRIGEVPQQATTGGMFSLDLAPYVTDREGGTLTYSVTSGGGSFAGSTYSNTFDTMGVYDVAFSVSDGLKTEDGTFRVRVTAANFAVVREDQSGLLLLDTATTSQLRVAAATATRSLAAGLADGRVVYQIAAGNGRQLWIVDPLTRTNSRIAATASGDVTYRARTSDGRLVYTTGTGDDQRLYFYNPATGVSRDVAQGVLSTVTVLVNAADLVFYEVGVNGQADVYAYDPSEDEVFAVGVAATDEQLQAVLPNGGVVFSRVGGGGEADLFYYRLGTGLVEIGSDVGSIATWNKVFGAVGSASQVVFAAQSGSVSDLYSWNPQNGQTTSISAAFTAGAFDVFAAIGAGNEVVLNRVVGPGEVDAFFYDLDSGANATVRDAGDISQVLGVTSDGTTAWALLRPSGTNSSMLAVSLVGPPATQTWAAGGEVTATANLLANGDVVAVRAVGTALNRVDVSTGTWGTPIAGAGLAFGGDGLDAGDFVYALTVSSQTDLSMWDESATASVAVSAAAGDDAYQARTLDGTVLFTRVTPTNGNADLFVWDGATATQLTDEDSAGLRHDHAVLGTYAGAR